MGENQSGPICDAESFSIHHSSTSKMSKFVSLFLVRRSELPTYDIFCCTWSTIEYVSVARSFGALICLLLKLEIFHFDQDPDRHFVPKSIIGGTFEYEVVFRGQAMLATSSSHSPCRAYHYIVRGQG